MTMMLALLYVGLAAGACALLATALSFWHPAFEIANDFLLFEIVGMSCLVAIALVMRNSFLIATTSVILTLLLMRLRLPLSSAAQRRSKRSPFLRIVSFNINQANRRLDLVARFISESDADLVALQEVNYATVREINRKLCAAPYHVIHGGFCKVALFAKDAYESSGFLEGTDNRPDLVWARFQRGGTTYEAFGAYLADPFHPHRQEQQVVWLIDYFRKRPSASIIAGDFNMTPFSTRLNNFARATGLKRHSTFLTSWPACILPPAFLIDHLFSTAEFVAIKTARGPSLDSDHYAIVADIGLAKPPPARLSKRFYPNVVTAESACRLSHNLPLVGTRGYMRWGRSSHSARTAPHEGWWASSRVANSAWPRRI